MYDTPLVNPPSKLVPVLAGSAAMLATVHIPLVSLINCLCCAGVMGGAVLGVWLYRRSFPPELPFQISDGVMVGLYSGLVASAASAVLYVVQFAFLAESSRAEFEDALDEAFSQMEVSGQDPAQIEQVRQLFMTLIDAPMLLAALILVFSIVIMGGFGALGGLIGGRIFRTPARMEAVDQP